MTLIVASRRLSQATLQDRYQGAIFLDVTSHGPEPWQYFSPFYPHGDIPVPFSPGFVSASVEGIWQGLKVFEKMDIDPTKFAITNMKGLKRTTRVYGKVIGHRKGVNGELLLPYVEARRLIYLPSYRWVLDHRLQDLLTELTNLSNEKSIVLLDYETNGTIEDMSKPLSHATLIKQYLQGTYPEQK